jgi:hydrogenase maturation protein HypF
LKPTEKTHDRKRIRFLFSGIVQGVGFRPFIYRIATRHHLSGYVQNRTDGVMAEVEGNDSSIESFIKDVYSELPPLAQIVSLERSEIETTGESGFGIIASVASGETNVHITPDIATCSECLSELFDPSDRRHLYPFINCTNCGPRLTIIKDIPYDRENTSMACFELCPDCRREYENPSDRRFHAEPNACPVCGPRLRLLDEGGKEISCEPIVKTAELIREGRIIAIKGIGGFHLCVDALNGSAVSRLRSRKYREEKPLAVMVKNIDSARTFARISDEEALLLDSPQKPIVLVEKTGSPISDLVAPAQNRLGLMLPYSPLHHLLFAEGFDALVMTSANQTDEPICTSNREAIARLKGIADYFLIHNRDILVHCDDSIAIVASGAPRITRRSRGYAPKPVLLDRAYPNVLALGPHLKTTVCVLKANAAYISPHIGDMETPQARDFYHQSIELMQDMTECRPKITACDMHPGYYSTRTAETMKTSIYRIQHHHAHIVSSMAENNLNGFVIGIALDGTGYGTDGTVWGGEILIANRKTFTRAGHLGTFILPGGEKAIKEPWRIAVGLLREAYKDEWPEYALKLNLLPENMSVKMFDKIMTEAINSPVTSSMGRLFDGIAALTGIRHRINFDGQAAMELEAASNKGSGVPYEGDFFGSDDKLVFDTGMLIRMITKDILSGVPSQDVGYRFHMGVSSAMAHAALALKEKHGIDDVVLSGGCFQNRLLLEGTMKNLEDKRLNLYHHIQVPTNDGGISLGQAVCAAEQELDRT